MKLIQRIYLSAALLLSALNLPAWAQDGGGYFLHTVAKGQSLYSIANMYDVSVDDIVRLNPGSRTQIRAGEALKIPQSKGLKNGDKIFHTIQPGETLYQLTVRYKVSAQAICNANPGLSADNFRIGQVISIPRMQDMEDSQPATTSSQPATASDRKWKEMHKVEKKETLFSICEQYGITEEALIAFNPELKETKLRKGMFLFIPYPDSVPARPATQTTPLASTPSNEELFSHTKPSGRPVGGTVNAALLLPFRAGSGTSEEQSRMVEYYEGFLMAVDSLKRQGVSVNLYTYDTQGSAATVATILAKPEIKQMNILFGPVHAACIAPVAEFARKHEIRLVVPFAPQVPQVFNNPYVYQVNTPQSYLYSEVYEHFLRKFDKAQVVFLDSGGNKSDKGEFISGLKQELKNNHISYKQLTLDTATDPERLVAVIDTLREAVFVPLAGDRQALTHLLPKLTALHRAHPGVKMHLFGYPEWQTYTQDYLASFYETDTYFYSSFYTNNLFPEAIRFSNAYRRWYSRDMANTYPKYGMLGFDTGYFFLKGLALKKEQLDEQINQVKVTPIQTGFKFERVNNWGGFINRKVFFVHFSSGYELIKLDFE